MKLQFLTKGLGLALVLTGVHVLAASIGEPGVVNVQARNIMNTPITGNAYAMPMSKRQVSADLQTVLNDASNLWAYQTVGGATQHSELGFLCDKYDLSRLGQQGYNTTIIHKIFCDASAAPNLASNADIAALTKQYSTYIWTTQAISSVLGKSAPLCEAINVNAANAVGLDGTIVQEDVCG